MLKFGMYLVTFAVAFGPPPSVLSEKPVTLIPGLGTWRHSIVTKNADAQKFFDQGLVLLYGFNRYEALRSFKKASALDPSALMPWWGIAMSQGPHINMDLDSDVDMKNSCMAVDAARRMPGAAGIERAWIQAIAERCPEYHPPQYIDAMRNLAADYPDDPDVLTFYAESLLIPVRWHWYNSDGRSAEGVSEAERVLQTVLRRYPDHPGANHLYIHAVESSSTPERAIPSAQRLMGIVPSAGHLVHMPGHIWFVLGDYERAAAVNERAVKLDLQYMRDSGVTSSSYFGYYVHNLHFISIARSMQGRMNEAIDASDRVAEAVKPFVKSMPEMADALSATPILMRVRFQLWDDVLGTSSPQEELVLSALVRHYGRAVALQAKDRHGDALLEQAAFERGRAELPLAALWMNNKAKDVLSVGANVLAARLSSSSTASISYWRRAVAFQDALAYDEPPGWYYPVRESLGAALLRAGNPSEAETVFREGLRRSPRNGRMLYGLLESLKQQKKTEAVEWVAREFERAWQGAEKPIHIEDL